MRMRDTTARRMALAGALALGGAAALAGTKPAAAGTAPITSCGAMITTPGTFVLVNDLLNCLRPAITVQASGVRLLLGNHTISGYGIPNIDGVSVNGIPAPAGVQIVGGTITGFATGLSVQGASDVRVSGVTASNNGFAGMFLENCSSCQIGNSQASNNGIVGILLEGNLTGAKISNNTTTDNNNIGIAITPYSSGVRLTGNVATGNAFGDLNDDTPAPPCANTWRGNTFATTSGAGAACIR